MTERLSSFISGSRRRTAVPSTPFSRSFALRPRLLSL